MSGFLTRVPDSREAIAPDDTGSGVSPAGAENEEYSWATIRQLVCVQNHPQNAGITMYVRWNGSSAASTTNWDVVLEPGDWAYSPVGLQVLLVQIYFTGACTLGTNYSVKGWA